MLIKDQSKKFSKVAYLHFVPQLDIPGRKGTKVLSPKPDYVDYLVFKLGNKSCELEYSNSIIRFVNYESDTETEKQANTVKLVTSTKLRGDGWMEVELGYFNSKEGSDGPVEARLLEMKRHGDKSGLIVEGIEFRPKIIKCRSS
uniref:F-box family protein n=1 Tax=Solanum tuberosum TaxID=4113 RepID=M1DPC3_SOLTU